MNREQQVQQKPLNIFRSRLNPQEITIHTLYNITPCWSLLNFLNATVLNKGETQTEAYEPRCEDNAITSWWAWWPWRWGGASLLHCPADEQADLQASMLHPRPNRSRQGYLLISLITNQLTGVESLYAIEETCSISSSLARSPQSIALTIK